MWKEDEELRHEHDNEEFEGLLPSVSVSMSIGEEQEQGQVTSDNDTDGNYNRANRMSGRSSSSSRSNLKKSGHSKKRRNGTGRIVLLSVVSIILLMLGWKYDRSTGLYDYEDDSSMRSQSQSEANGHDADEHVPRMSMYSCPTEQIARSKNDYQEEGDSLSDFYGDKGPQSKNGKKSKSALTLADIDRFKTQKYDGWNHKYHELKQIKQSWVAQTFSSLQSGDTIFETACGRGFNLLLHTEILKEQYNITNLTIYGIEYVQGSVDVANDILDIALPSVGSQLGHPGICRADASNLFFIPDNSFDLVFTGFIDPLWDPLDIKSVLGRDLEPSDVCNVTIDDNNDDDDGDEYGWARVKLAQLDQRAQEDWFASWVTEMIRIAKKGKPVIMEEVTMPMCDVPGDWGGVSQRWWKEAVLTYGWDVDVDSIVIDEAREGKATRYNVFMRKNA